MKNLFKRIVIFTLCISLVVCDCTIPSLATEIPEGQIDLSEVETSDETVEEMVDEEDFIESNSYFEEDIFEKNSEIEDDDILEKCEEISFDDDSEIVNELIESSDEVITAQEDAMYVNNKYVWPVAGATRISISGTDYSSTHQAIDVACKRGDILVAPFSGKVVQVYRGCVNHSGVNGVRCESKGVCKPNCETKYKGFCNFGYGNGVIIKSNTDELYCALAHMDDVNVEEGQSVVSGQRLGMAGDTGNSTGVHCHFVISRKATKDGSSYWNMVDTINPKNVEYDFISSPTNVIPSDFSLSCKKPTGNLTRGDSFTTSGYVESNNKIKTVMAGVYKGHNIKVQGIIVGEAVSFLSSQVFGKAVSVNDYRFSWGAYSDLGNARAFESLPAGEYTYIVMAMDEAGKGDIQKSEFTVVEKQNVVNYGSPSISLSDSKNTLGEDNATRTAVIKNPNNSRISETGMILRDSWGNEIARVSEKMNAYDSTMTAWYATNSNTKTNLNIVLTPGTKYSYEMYAYVAGNRIAAQGEFTTLGSPKPQTPILTANRTEFATDDILTLTWNEVKYAKNGYDVTLYKKDGSYSKSISTTLTSANFVFPDGGEYSATIVAKGYINSDTGYLGQSIYVHGDSKVTFVEEYEDGTQRIIKEEVVKYKRNATAPQAPSRTGWIFQGWDKSYMSVEQDMVIKALFTKCKYNVVFKVKDSEGKYYELKTEQVEFQGQATPPTDIQAPNGYAFIGWDTNEYENVTKSTVITATYVYVNDALPVQLQADSCTFDSDGSGYTVKYSVSNYDKGNTTGRAIVFVKTADGRLVRTTESNAFVLKRNEIRNSVEVFVPFEKETDCDAAYAEVIIVDSYKNDIPLSESKRVNITREWSGWSDKTPPESATDTESKVEYRYRDKSTTTSSSSSLAGWDYVSTEGYWGNYGSWSGWSRNPYYASDSRKVDTRTVTDVAGYTLQQYYFYKYWKSGKGWMYSYTSRAGNTGVSSQEYREIWINQSSDSRKMVYYGVDDGLYNMYTCQPYQFYQVEYFYPGASQWVPAVTHTEYRCADRQYLYKYHFSKWSEWSPWSSTIYTGSSTREVEKRTVYRYKTNVAAAEDTDGEVHTVSGKVDSGLAGKQILMVVYKYNEPSDSNNEYIAQSVVGDDGSYSFTFRTREEPSVETGDYTIKVGIEGSTDLMYVDTIVAPKKEYSVKFIDWDGTEIEKQVVKEGENAIAPNDPVREGYRFVGWNTGLSNVHDNLYIEALYVLNTCTVVFIDRGNENSCSIEEYPIGSDIVYPEWKEMEGYNFIGWFDENGNEVIKADHNMVLTALYEEKIYSVKFYGADGSILSEQEVLYGQSAYPPIPDEVEGRRFVSWSTYDYSSVKSDLDIYPSYNYYETTSKPSADKKSAILDDSIQVELSCPDDDATIFYTLDGETPTIYSDVYTEPITIDENVVLRFFARSDSKNESDIVSEAYLMKNAEDDSGALSIKNNKLNLCVGDEGPKITYFLFHEDPSMQVEFHSLDDSIVSVDEEGRISINGVGHTQVFVVTKDYRYADYCDITVTSNEIKLEKLNITEKEVEMFVGDEHDLITEIYPLNATYQDITWASDNYDVVQVNEEGHLIAKGVGTAYVTAYSHSGNNIAYCFVTVNGTSLSISEQNVVVALGSKYQLNAQIRGLAQDVTWKSDNPDAVTVDNAGLLEAVGPGTATILVSMANGDFRTCEVRVTNGRVSAEPPAAPEVDEVTDTSITLKLQEGCEYSLDGKNWQDNPQFIGLVQMAEYVAYSRVKATDSQQSSSASKGTVIRTLETQIVVQNIEPQTYTGTALKPEPIVTYGETVLKAGVDYSVSYKYNTNASATSPVVVIKGKTLYDGTIQKPFVIEQKDITDSDIEIANMTVAYNKKKQQVKPTIKYGKKTLSIGKDVIVTYPDTKAGAYIEVGTYTIHLEGKGNYTGACDVPMVITGGTLISKTSISAPKAETYDGLVHNPKPIVKNKGIMLTEGIDYELSYPDSMTSAYVLPGTYRINVIGKGDYAGVKTINFKINGVQINKSVVEGWIPSFEYMGEPITQDEMQISLKGVELKEDVDYSISYVNNNKAGTATATITGINGYSGTVRKTFKIVAYDIANDESGLVTFEDDLNVVEYSKGGACPNYVIYFDGHLLEKNKDYSVSYSNNKSVTNDLTKKMPTATIKGKGNFSGIIKKEYDIIEQDLVNLSIEANDVVYSNNTKFYKIKPSIIDLDGKKLQAGKDFDKNYHYSYYDGSEIGINEIPEVGSELRVTVTGLGNYVGEISATYHVGSVMISKAKVDKIKKSYTGDPVELSTGELKVTYQGLKLIEGRDFVIIEDTYSRNITPGTATVYIQGIGDFAGTAKVTYTVSKKKMI